MTIRYYQRLTYESGEGGLADSFGLAFWLAAYRSKVPQEVDDLIVAYLQGKTIPDCLDALSATRLGEISTLMDWFVASLRKTSLDNLVERMKGVDYALFECAENIPQLSTLEGSTLGIVDILASSETAMTYVRLGYQLYGADSQRNETAKRKYGENAAKFASILGLVQLGHDIKDPTAPNRIAVELTPIGAAVARASGDRMEIVARLLLRSALFRDLICSECAERAETFVKTVNELSPETRLRRTSAFSAMLQVFRSYGGALPDGSRAEELLCRMRR